MPGGRITRRRFIGFAAISAALISAVGLRHRWTNVGTLRHEAAPGATGTADQDVVETVTAFLASYFGVELSDEDVADLDDRLRFAMESDGGWAKEYRWMSGYLDDAAEDAEVDRFLLAGVSMREEIVRVAVAGELSWRAQRLRALFRTDGRELLRMRRSTIPHLVRLYRFSGVPWRQRGYSSWPGRPDEQLAYTRAIEGRAC